MTFWMWFFWIGGIILGSLLIGLLTALFRDQAYQQRDDHRESIWSVPVGYGYVYQSLFALIIIVCFVRSLYHSISLKASAGWEVVLVDATRRISPLIIPVAALLMAALEVLGMIGILASFILERRAQKHQKELRAAWERGKNGEPFEFPNRRREPPFNNGTNDRDNDTRHEPNE